MATAGAARWERAAGAGKVGAGKVGAGKVGAGKVGAGKVGAGKVGAGEVSQVAVTATRPAYAAGLRGPCASAWPGHEKMPVWA
jgi:hypothetical protein